MLGLKELPAPCNYVVLACDKKHRHGAPYDRHAYGSNVQSGRRGTMSDDSRLLTVLQLSNSGNFRVTGA